MILCIMVSGCSVLFDPVKAPGCSCPALPNAVAACADSNCSYSCSSNFVDGNGDLAEASSDGCELDCSGGAPPANPAALTARVGARAGEIEWSFPASPAAARYRFCTAPENCDPVPVCTAGSCSVSTTGHPDNTRVSGTVLSIDTCGRVGSMATAATVIATPLDLSSPAGWTLEQSCPASTSSVLGGQLAIENPMGVCTSSLVAGDELSGDFTLDADLRFSGTAPDSLLAGFAFLQNGTGHRMAALVAQSSNNLSNELSVLTQRKNNTEKSVAGSIAGASPAGALTHLRVTVKGNVVSFSHGPDEQRLVEVLRWSDGVSRTGKLGMGLAGAGRAELTNFRVTTPGTLPTGSPTSVFIDFADGGFPSTVRQKLPQALRIEDCPSLPASARCDGGCLPSPTSKCAHVERAGLSFPNFVVDLPAGVDVRAPYSLSVRFAVAPDGGGSFPAPISSTQGALLSAGTWFMPTRGLDNVPYGVTLEPGMWHAADFSFNPDGGSFQLSLDEQRVTLPPNTVFPPAGWSPHLGAFSFGEGLQADIYVTDLRISQP